MALQTCVSPALRERAAAALTIRLVHWHGDFLPRPGRFKNKIPKGFASLTTVRADPIELLIVRAIAMTSTPGAAQFGVSPDGSVFTTDVNGHSLFRGRRIDVTGLSPLLDEAADIFNHRRGGIGGRFYERDGNFFKADGKKVFVQVIEVAPEDLRDVDSGTAKEIEPAAPRVWWQRIVDSVWDLFREDGEVVPNNGDVLRRRSESALPEWVPPPRRTSINKGRQRPPQYCPKHHIELPATGRCDECQ
jgi:hypothetical protein